jgi:hypothetical protein
MSRVLESSILMVLAVMSASVIYSLPSAFQNNILMLFPVVFVLVALSRAF